MPGDPDPDDSTLQVIETRIATLESGAPASSEAGAWTQEDVDKELAELRADHVQLHRHWQLATQTVADGEPARCDACGEPRNCSAARVLFAKYR
jgi:hypothetical protein